MNYGDHLAPSRVRPSPGFTLLELLVSMFVLSLIVIGCATLYHEASLAWETGVDRTETTLMGRGLAQLMAAEISEAIGSPNPPLLGNDPLYFDLSGNRVIKFARLTTDPAGATNAYRSLVRVMYDGLAFGSVITRQLSVYTNGTYSWNPAHFDAGTRQDIGDNVDGAYFFPDPNWGGAAANILPKYVDIYVDIIPGEYVKRGDWGSLSIPEKQDRVMTYHARAYLVNRYRYE